LAKQITRGNDEIAFWLRNSDKKKIHTAVMKHIMLLLITVSSPISNVSTESSGKNSFPHSDSIFSLSFDLDLLSISIDFIPLSSSNSFKLFVYYFFILNLFLIFVF
jgi:hypothetical protein